MRPRTALAAGRRHSVGRRGDGRVVAVGGGAAGELGVGRWEHVVAVAAGNVHTAANTGRSHTVGLRADGTVVATGWNGDGQCDLGSWRGVVAVAAGWRRTLGLHGDGTVVAAGRTVEGACDVDTWREVVAISCGDWHSVGVRADGTAVAAGVNRRGQCDVDTWQGLTDIAAGYLHTVGLRTDGRLAAVRGIRRWVPARSRLGRTWKRWPRAATTPLPSPPPDESWPRATTPMASATSTIGAMSSPWQPAPPHPGPTCRRHHPERREQLRPPMRNPHLDRYPGRGVARGSRRDSPPVG